MKTTATIYVDDIFYFVDKDGDPDIVIDELLLPMIKEAKEKDKRNPDFDFITIFKYKLLEKDLNSSKNAIFDGDYEYEVDKKGNIKWKDAYEDDEFRDASLREWVEDWDLNFDVDFDSNILERDSLERLKIKKEFLIQHQPDGGMEFIVEDIHWNDLLNKIEDEINKRKK